jgi:transmembrane E3 ubiquitin-protein ligase
LLVNGSYAQSCNHFRSKTFFRKVTTCKHIFRPNVHPAHLIILLDAGTAAFSYFVLLVLLARQTHISRTPAGVSRVSRYSFITQAIVDSVSFAGHITFAILTEGRPSLSLVAPAFLACILFVYESVSVLD